MQLKNNTAAITTAKNEVKIATCGIFGGMRIFF